MVFHTMHVKPVIKKTLEITNCQKSISSNTSSAFSAIIITQNKIQSSEINGNGYHTKFSETRDAACRTVNLSNSSLTDNTETSTKIVCIDVTSMSKRS